MPLIEIPDDGIIRIPMNEGNTTIGEYRVNLSSFPVVTDVAPVVHAMWMLDSSFYSARIYHCTACNTKQMQTSKFCPECGARMDGEENAAD